MAGLNKVKDYANSWQQKSWEHAAAQYERMKAMLLFKNKRATEYAQKTMAELEIKYPVLAKK
jgi:hypothetical protein